MGQEALLLDALGSGVTVEIPQEEVGLLRERLEGAAEPVERTDQPRRICHARRLGQGLERLAHLVEHRDLERAGAPHGGLDLAHRPVGGLADGGEPIDVATPVEILDPRYGASVVGALQVAPLGELVEVAVEIGDLWKREVEVGTGQPFQQLRRPQLDDVVRLGLHEDLEDGAVVRSVLRGDVAEGGHLSLRWVEGEVLHPLHNLAVVQPTFLQEHQRRWGCRTVFIQ